MASGVRVSSSWQNINGVNARVGGSWTPCTKIWVRVGGSWTQAWPSVTVSPRADGRANPPLIGGTCYVGCEFRTTGVEYELDQNNNIVNSTTWLDAGSSSDVYIEFVRTGGNASSWTGFSNSPTRYQLNTNRKFYISTTAPLWTIEGYFRMYNTSTGGSPIWTGPDVTWSASVETE